MGIPNCPRIRHVSSHIAVLTLFSGLSWSQTPDQAVASFVGQGMILPKGGDQYSIKLKKPQLSRMKGECDVAVMVKDADWKAEVIRFRLENIGTVSVMNQPRSVCRIWQDEIVLQLSGFGPNEAADSVLNSVRRVLQTPDEYLASKGVHFSIPAGAGEEVPAKPPPPIIYPKSLLRVDGAYTSAARSARLKGAVTVRLIVGTDGRAHKVRLMRGLGFGLDENAMKVFPLWRFEPALQMDKAVAVESTVEMHFDIM